MVSMDAFAAAFGFDAKSDDVWTALGKVTAINGTTLSVLLGGSATPMECEAYCLPKVGDIVFVAISKGKARAIAVKGGGAFLPLGGGQLTGALAFANYSYISTGSSNGQFYIHSGTSATNKQMHVAFAPNDDTITIRNSTDGGETWGDWGWFWHDGMSPETTTSNIITADTSNVTISSAQFARWGKLAMLQVNFTNKNAITVPASGDATNFEVGIIASGKRPAVQCAAVCDGDDAHAYAYIGTGGSMKVGGFDSHGSQYTIASGTKFYMYATYVLA